MVLLMVRNITLPIPVKAMIIKAGANIVILENNTKLRPNKTAEAVWITAAFLRDPVEANIP